jgi:hypothetical protein
MLTLLKIYHPHLHLTYTNKREIQANSLTEKAMNANVMGGGGGAQEGEDKYINQREKKCKCLSSKKYSAYKGIQKGGHTGELPIMS